jgi:hypothetical protein
MLLRVATTLLACAAAVSQTAAAHVAKRQATNRLVFAHFMIGIVSNRVSSADYDWDMQRAKRCVPSFPPENARNPNCISTATVSVCVAVNKAQPKLTTNIDAFALNM